MSLLTFSQLAQSFGADDIFIGLSGSIPHGAKVGMVGRTGSARRRCCAFWRDENGRLPARRNLSPGAGRSFLARFLFRGEDVFKRVAMLSGGERGRLALALLALDEAYFLLLDEPTNHLDLPSQEVLQEALLHFPGTMLLVTHDRYLVQQVWWLDEDGRFSVRRQGYRSGSRAPQPAVTLKALRAF